METPAGNPHVRAPRGRPLYTALALGAGVVVIGLFLAIRLLFGPAFVSRAFDGNAWRVNPVSDQQSMDVGTVRQTMVDDLLKQRKLIGMTEHQVETMLGAPDRVSKADYEYTLGRCRSSFGMDPEVLHVTFEKGRAVKAQILQH